VYLSLEIPTARDLQPYAFLLFVFFGSLAHSLFLRYIANLAVLIPSTSTPSARREPPPQLHYDHATKNSAHFEEGIIQSAWSMFDEWRARASLSPNWHLASLASNREWIQFSARSDRLLNLETPLCGLKPINYPLKEDTSIVAVTLNEKNTSLVSILKVTTSSPALHEFSLSDPTTPAGQKSLL